MRLQWARKSGWKRKANTQRGKGVPKLADQSGFLSYEQPSSSVQREFIGGRSEFYRINRSRKSQEMGGNLGHFKAK